MKTAAAYPIAFDVACPECKAELICPSSGSMMIGRDSVYALISIAQQAGRAINTAACQDCACIFRLPVCVTQLAV